MEDTKVKNNKGKIIIAAISVVVIIAIIAIICVVVSKSSNKVEGTYELVSMMLDGEEASEEDIQLMKSFGLTVTIEMNKDQTGTLYMFGEKNDLVYEKGQLWMNDETYSYSVSGDKLTLEQENDKLVFQRIDPSEITEQPTTGAE